MSKTTNKERRITNGFAGGSALIMTVVLTSLLAIVGVVFVMLARVDEMSTSAIAENKQLNLAVDSVVARICDELAWDVPGIGRSEYYDYPGYMRAPGPDGTLFTPDDVVTGDSWLASLEPRIDDNGTPGDLTDDVYYWPQISDIYEVVPGSRVGLLEGYGVGDWRELVGFGDKVQPHNLRAQIIPEANSVSGAIEFVPPNRRIDYGGPADADGDGVADSRWVQLPNMTSKGRDIYAAIRIIDNGGMLNVNTGYKFDPNNPGLNGENIDGSSQMQINLLDLARRGTWYTPQQEHDRLLSFRCANAPNDIRAYEYNVVRRYDRPTGLYTPFDISDELKLRNRYILNYNKITTRIERMWTWAYDEGIEMPRVSSGYLQNDPNYWFYRTNNSCPYDPCLYDYRHISTTYNMDRIIDPNGNKMFNVNRIDPVAEPNVIINLYRTIRDDIGNASWAAQIAANIKDYGDSYSDVTTVYDLYDSNGEPNRLGDPHYGFERPCIYISELVHKFAVEEPGASRHRSYAIELRKGYAGANSDQWQVRITRKPDPNVIIPVTDFGQDASRYRVIVFEDPCASLASEIVFTDSPADGETGVDPNVILRWEALPTADANYSHDVYFADNNSLGFVGNFAYDNTSYYPGPLGTNSTYYWRIDDIYDGNEIGTSGVWQFTTWSAEPNSIYKLIDSNHPSVFALGTTISLERWIPPGVWISVDAVPLPLGVLPPWLVIVADPNEGMRSFKRDVSDGFWVKRIWDYVIPRPPSLGNNFNHYFAADPNFVVAAGIDPNPIQAWPANYFRNIGEIGKVLRKSAYIDFIDPSNTIDPFDNESTARLDLIQPRFQEFFKYLTRFDPSWDGIDNDGDVAVDEQDGSEFKIAGRININTAPWYVIAQLPWVEYPDPKANFADRVKLARAIVAYRDKLKLEHEVLDYSGGRGQGMADLMGNFEPIPVREEPGFASIGELLNVTQNLQDNNPLNPVNPALDPYYDIRRYGRDAGDQLTFPDLSYGGGRALGDGVWDDFEERDLIFARISDLVTVRSDVFTAYILVRIGPDGPQKRVVAIVDRSDAYTPVGSVRVRTLHSVPDPR